MSLGVTPENYGFEETMQSTACHIRERLMTEGYSTVLHDWVKQIATVCDERDLGRMIQLLELAASYQRKAKIRTTPFVNLVRAKTVESPTASPIRVMSIHKSKGLEFDIVVLPELEVNLTGTKPPKVAAGREESPTSPISVVMAYPAKDIRSYLPERFKRIAVDSETEHAEESLCLLYVAMTRAVHELLMILMPKEESASTKKNSTPSGENNSFSKTMAGVLHAGLSPNHFPADQQTVLYENGDKNWAVKQFGNGEQPDSGPSFDGEEQNRTIPLAAKSKKPSKNLTRMTPSSREGTGGVGFRIQASNFASTEHSPLATLYSPLDWGTATHACFEQVTWLEQGLPERETLLGLVMPMMSNVNSATKVIDAFYASCDMPNVRAALSLETYRNTVSADKRSAMRWDVQNERRFWATPQPDVLLQGSIDRLVLQYDDSDAQPRVIAADVIDFKSDRIETDEELDARVEYYAPQLAAYREAVSAMYGLLNKQITTRLLFVHNGVVRTV